MVQHQPIVLHRTFSVRCPRLSKAALPVASSAAPHALAGSRSVHNQVGDGGADKVRWQREVDAAAAALQPNTAKQGARVGGQEEREVEFFDLRFCVEFFFTKPLCVKLAVLPRCPLALSPLVLGHPWLMTHRAAACEAGCVDAHQATKGVQERAPAVAPVDAGIRLSGGGGGGGWRGWRWWW